MFSFSMIIVGSVFQFWETYLVLKRHAVAKSHKTADDVFLETTEVISIFFNFNFFKFKTICWKNNTFIEF